MTHVTVEDYAASMWDVEVAAEMARQRPDDVGSIVMISAPVITEEDLQAFHPAYEFIPLDEAGTRSGLP